MSRPASISPRDLTQFSCVAKTRPSMTRPYPTHDWASRQPTGPCDSETGDRVGCPRISAVRTRLGHASARRRQRASVAVGDACFSAVEESGGMRRLPTAGYRDLRSNRPGHRHCDLLPASGSDCAWRSGSPHRRVLQSIKTSDDEHVSPGCVNGTTNGPRAISSVQIAANPPAPISAPRDSRRVATPNRPASYAVRATDSKSGAMRAFYPNPFTRFEI